VESLGLWLTVSSQNSLARQGEGERTPDAAERVVGSGAICKPVAQLQRIASSWLVGVERADGRAGQSWRGHAEARAAREMEAEVEGCVRLGDDPGLSSMWRRGACRGRAAWICLEGHRFSPRHV
jgi:hypothetical protein